MRDPVMILSSPSKRPFLEAEAITKKKVTANLREMSEINEFQVKNPPEMCFSFHFYADFDPLAHGWTLVKDLSESTEDYLDTTDFQQALNGQFVKRDGEGIITIKQMVRNNKSIAYRKHLAKEYSQCSISPFSMLIQSNEYKKDAIKLIASVTEYKDGDTFKIYQIRTSSEADLKTAIVAIQQFNPKESRSRIMEGIYRYKGSLYAKIAEHYEVKDKVYYSNCTDFFDVRHSKSPFKGNKISFLEQTIMDMRKERLIPLKYPDPHEIGIKAFEQEFNKLSEQDDYSEKEDDELYRSRDGNC